ncbi:MAG: hypothetical protein ATN35_12680 [Epulopiscium sp. Nele67-Bin004]|nr:MAG: hypothetical protein ATN35_12680 [Epulopiscium sp. Nele67-Bin004]
MVGKLFCVIWGASGGLTIAAALMSFVTEIGVIPRMMERGQIQKYFMVVANAAILGILFGTVAIQFEISVIIPKFCVVIFGLATGIFMGCLAISLAEVLNMFPVIGRRLKIKKGMRLFVISFAIGKLVGALYFWLMPGFVTIVLRN